ncbi:hypothetical protein [Gaopeijia maritima]|uniref:Uncharacterized protein n=1 Tax=Gaopeijia maritima TaxID=3119007 RepID=A0ABU9E733_9BACT
MTPPTDAPPPSPPSGRAPAVGRGARDPDPYAQERSWARRHPGRVRAIAFGASAALHLLALLFYPAIEVRFGEVDSAPDGGPAEVEGIEVVNLQELSDEVEAPLDPEELASESFTPLVPLPEAPGEDLAPQVEVAAPDPGPSAAERLRPATLSEELWIPLVPDAMALSDQELVRNLVYRRLAAFNDSMAVRAARAAQGTDWTYTDDEGNRWGISPGQLHLGSITVPLPFSFGNPTGASDDQLDRLFMDREIQRAAGLLRTDQTIRERAAAIKARIDAERARRGMAGDTLGGR